MNAGEVRPCDPGINERAAYRAGFNAGEKAGALRYFQAPIMENIAVELTLLRRLYPLVCNALADAQHQVGVLEAELDYRAPGWDRP